MQNCHIRSQWETNLRQMKWWLQNRPNTKNGSLPVTALFFRNFCFSLRTSYKELIYCTNNTNANICTFCKRWGFIWRCFFPVSVLKNNCRHGNLVNAFLRTVFLQKTPGRLLLNIWYSSIHSCHCVKSVAKVTFFWCVSPYSDSILRFIAINIV